MIRRAGAYIQKGLKGGTGGYQGTLWHTSQVILALLTMLPMDNLILQTAILVPQAGAFARVIETCWPKWFLCEMMVMRGFPCVKSR